MELNIELRMELRMKLRMKLKMELRIELRMELKYELKTKAKLIKIQIVKIISIPLHLCIFSFKINHLRLIFLHILMLNCSHRLILAFIEFESFGLKISSTYMYIIKILSFL